MKELANGANGASGQAGCRTALSARGMPLDLLAAAIYQGSTMMLRWRFGCYVRLLIASVGLWGSGLTEACKGSDRTYLDVGEVAAIGAAGAAVGIGGMLVKRLAVDHRPWIRGHMPGEVVLQNWLGGECRAGKRNFFDNNVGSMLMPAAAIVAIAGLDLGYPRGSAVRDAGQDVFVLGAGLAATKGITDILKGVVARKRPVYCILGNEAAPADDPGFLRHSFPSGHASGAFFSAAFLNLRAREVMRREMSGDDYRSWHWASSLVTYGWASVVGLSRVHAYKHHLSDVIVGAAIGVAVAELVYGIGERSSANGGEGLTMLRVSFAI